LEWKRDKVSLFREVTIMASSQDFAEYVMNQIQGVGMITVKKMFGEYGVYCDNKIVGLISDNQFFVKETEGGRKFLGEYEEGEPYPGAKLCFLLDDDLEDVEKISKLINITYMELPEPKPKKKKQKDS